jgi:hypothetical protein
MISKSRQGVFLKMRRRADNQIFKCHRGWPQYHEACVQKARQEAYVLNHKVDQITGMTGENEF